MAKNITPRAQDYAEWYLDVVAAADLAENSPVRGCMVIKPYGFALWENIKTILDKMIKETGHQNAYFPLFIPKSFLSKEASHVEGFAKECAVITHYRLKADPQGKGVVVDPEAKLEEELIVRPTSETIMYATYAKWIHSYRDLPLLINQWANIVRWEMRTRLFLRTAEFLWQEGHTAHATHEEAHTEVLKMLDVYADLAENYLAMPVIKGPKTPNERFAGALDTYAIEAMMQDGKALQAGTSHDLGQNFAKAFEVQFTDKDGQIKHVWQTSWGVSTRLIGGLIMTHSDDKGLVLPPRVAPVKVVILPISKSSEDQASIQAVVQKLATELKTSVGDIKVDDRDYCTLGEKIYEWEKKGVPVRLEIGPKDLEKNQVVLVRRDTGDKEFVAPAEAPARVVALLEEIQMNLLYRAQQVRTDRTYRTDDYAEFNKILTEKPGFIQAHWCEQGACEEQIAAETKATIRCIPFDTPAEAGQCIKCGQPSPRRVIFAKSY